MQFSTRIGAAAAYTLGILFAVCTALPINANTNDHANELIIGVLALICVSAVIVACACCHRNKSGFEEFENETTLADQTIRSEFPIFRAISPQTVNNVQVTSNNSTNSNNGNNAANGVLSNNFNQNHMNRDYDQFEIFQNNNGPISPADIENIQNNNAVDYIPNRNEIGIVVEPSIYSINRNLVELNTNAEVAEVENVTGSSNMQIVDATHVKSSSELVYLPSPSLSNHLPITLNPFNNIVAQSDDINFSEEQDHRNNTCNNVNVDIHVENVRKKHSELECVRTEHNNFNNKTENNHFNDENSIISTNALHHTEEIIDQLPTSSDANAMPLNDDEFFSERNTMYYGSESPKSSASSNENENENDLTNDDIRSVEEALRELDFAISGEESLLPDYENDKNNFDNDIANDSDSDKLSTCITNNVQNELNSNNGANKMISKLLNGNNNDDIYEEAILLVDNIIGTCQNVVTLEHVNDSKSIEISNRNNVYCTDRQIEKMKLIDDNENENMNANLDDSIEYKFLTGKLEASTPCTRTKKSNDIANKPKKATGNLFPILDISNENDFSQNDCQLFPNTQPANENVTADNKLTLEKIQQNVTYNATSDKNESLTQTPGETIDKFIDQTFVSAAASTNDETFFVVATESDKIITVNTNRLPNENPIIIIDKDEVTSEDLTTITPMNTPIELNYAADSWDNFISKSMNQQKHQPQPSSTASPPSEVLDDSEILERKLENNDLAIASGSHAWFLHPQQQQQQPNNATYDMNDTENNQYNAAIGGLDDDYDDDNDITEVEEDEELLSLTFDALRKQLAVALPHASGNVTTAPPDFSDDENDNDHDDSEPSIERCIEMQPEIVINYKRQLSPILEESEDETCKTFIMNEIKCLDSTSTGCLETGEAIMGVTKVLMASNDTLFNFEDTLGDRDDMFSPRNSSHSGNNTATSNTPQPINCKTPTNDIHSSDVSDNTAIERHNEQIAKTTFATRPTLLHLDFDMNDGNRTPPNPINDLLSPEQPKTFSEEINTVELLSSDFSGTIDATTNTLDDLKTCISVHLKDDADKGLSENSYIDWAESVIPSIAQSSTPSECDDTNTNGNDTTGLDIDEGNKIEINDDNLDNISIETTEDDKSNRSFNDHPIIEDTNFINNYSIDGGDTSGSTRYTHQNTLDFLTNEIEYTSSQNYLSKKLNDLSEHSKENKSPNTTIVIGVAKMINGENLIKTASSNENATNVILNAQLSSAPEKITSNFQRTNDKLSDLLIDYDMPKHMPMNSNSAISDNDIQSERNCLVVEDDSAGQLSGEEDPWAHPIADIRFNGPSSQVMSTTFGANDWDSDIEDSNSSEEFMYVRGTTVQPIYLQSAENFMKLFDKNDKGDELAQQNKLELNGKIKNDIEQIDEQPDIHSIWNSHKDQIAVTLKDAKHSADDNLAESSSNSSDIEGEWVPSSWDSLAQPSRSALKSPDKSSSEEDAPCQKNRRSVVFKKQNYHSVYEYPKETVTLSPALSEPQMWQKFSACSPFSGDSSDANKLESNGIEGFAISSSTRPFHSSQFNAQCHTWPTDSDFSWSQVQNDGQIIANEKFPSYLGLPVEWPKKLEEFYIPKNENSEDIEFHRPDSGVGESAELLSETLSLGDMCHAKSSLRLPLKVYPAVVMTTNINTDKSHQNAVSLTSDSTDSIAPISSTCSVDSLSSSSSSVGDLQINLTTPFGKQNWIYSGCDTSNHNDNPTENDIPRESHTKNKNQQPIQNESSLSTELHQITSKFIENEVNAISQSDNYFNEKTSTDPSAKSDRRTTTNRQSDSTDEDSGIESIIRVVKET